MEILTTQWPEVTLAYAPDVGDHGGFAIRARADGELMAFSVGPDIREGHRMAFEYACELVGMACDPFNEGLAWCIAADKIAQHHRSQAN
jgi:hypothetical protein